MHAEARQFVQRASQLFPDNFADCKVLEVGSLNVNGSIRDLFTDCDYTGIDLMDGPGVDAVCHLNTWNAEPESYQTVISLEAMEHDRHWKESLKRMYDLTAPRGMLLMTCAGPERAEHGTTKHDPASSPATNDWYHNLTTADIEMVFDLRKDFRTHCLWYRRDQQDLQFCGIKWITVNLKK